MTYGNSWFELADSRVQGGKRAFADPRRVLRMNPLEITRHCRMHAATKRQFGSKWWDLGRIEGGEWDVQFEGLRNLPLEETHIHQSVYERIVEGVDWQDTVAYARKSEVIRQGLVIDNCATVEQLDDRYRRLDRLIGTISDEGWALEQEVGGDFRNNIAVSISRTGNFLLASGGAHRLAIAKILRLPEIRVYVLMRHERWQSVRDRFALGDIPFLDHPDLEDLRC